jgi:hypothetical protein
MEENKMLKDIKDLNTKFGINKFVNNSTKKQKLDYLWFRADFIHEELDELYTAINDLNTSDIVDALIDITVITLGTLDAFDVDTQKAWDKVQNANMSKELGVNKNRINQNNLPDLVKPKGWQAPCHKNNIGKMEDIT